MKNKLNILVISPFFYPHIGGSQQYIEEICAALVKNHKNINITVLTYNTDSVPIHETYRGLKIVRISCLNVLPGQFAVPNYLHLIEFLLTNKNKFDILYCNTRFFESSWWAPIYAKLTGKKILITDHCAFYPEHNNPVIKLISRIVDRTVSGFYLKFYNQVVVTSKATQSFLRKEFGISSSVIYGGINKELFKPEKSNNRNPIILFVGRMIESKGSQFLFKIAEETPQANFIFAGPGPLVNVLKRKIKKDKSRNIKILGGITRNEVAKLMQTCDILVHASIHNEGFPNVLTEAGASRLAVIATDTGGVFEIIPKGCGVLIKTSELNSLSEKLNNLIKNKALRLKYASNLYKHVTKQFDWGKSSEKLYIILKRLHSS